MDSKKNVLSIYSGLEKKEGHRKINSRKRFCEQWLRVQEMLIEYLARVWVTLWVRKVSGRSKQEWARGWDRQQNTNHPVSHSNPDLDIMLSLRTEGMFFSEKNMIEFLV